MNTKNKPSSVPLAVLRIGMSLVFIWFGTQQFLHTQSWVSYIPQWVMDMSSLDAVTLVHINGAFEIVFGIALLLGICTRVTALLLALHMAEIAFTVGYDSIGVRDFGLTIATFAIFLYGADRYCLDRFISKVDTDRKPLIAPK
jgi:uncharacterized membrane protein YphA (DoxX/SURF4 family)